MLSRAKLNIVLPSMLAALAVPATAGAVATGGAGLAANAGKAGSGSPSQPTSTSGAQPVKGAIETSGNGFTIRTSSVALLRSKLTFRGTVSGAPAGATVLIQRRGRQTGNAWTSTATARVRSGGDFSATWPTNHTGRFAVRAVLRPPAGVAHRASAASPTLTVTVYRPAIATTYGEGSWGSQTACGEILHRNTLGVANRTLPCGTPVSLLWHGRTITVPVIDRGPYANHADWDLTLATASALHMDGTETIGAVSLPR